MNYKLSDLLLMSEALGALDALCYTETDEMRVEVLSDLYWRFKKWVNDYPESHPYIDNDMWIDDKKKEKECPF